MLIGPAIVRVLAAGRLLEGYKVPRGDHDPGTTGRPWQSPLPSRLL